MSDSNLRLGDIMRGERANRGKSLLDVQRELRIKASYIAAIENADYSLFETSAFISGYVHSYARYLGLEPGRAYEMFCEESGFTPGHGRPGKGSLFPIEFGSSAEPRHKRMLDIQTLLDLVLFPPKAILFIVLFPILRLSDLVSWVIHGVRSRETGSLISFQSVSPLTTDWWSIFSALVGSVCGLLTYLSPTLNFQEDWALNVLFALGVATLVTALFLWFHPRLFFARFALMISAPLLFSSMLGIEFAVRPSGDILGGYVSVGAEPSPVKILVSGLLCFVALIFFALERKETR